MSGTSLYEAPFVISKAAAGSGKTFTLVLEYLKLALAGPREGVSRRFRDILAITFTNKAVNEMKSRIMKELDRMVCDGIDPADSKSMGAHLFAEMKAMDYYRRNPLTPEQLQQMATELQNAILHHYTDLSVFTIDSFMHRIVRTFAHDLGQPVSFDLMTDTQVLIDEVVEQLMSLVGTEGNEELTQILQAYSDSSMDRAVDNKTKGVTVESSIARLAKLLFDDSIEHRLKSLSGLTLSDFRTIHRRYTDANRKAEQRLRAIGSEFLSLVQDTGVADSDCYYKDKGFLRYFTKLAKGEMKEPNSYVTTSMTGGNLVSGECSADKAERLEALRPQMEQLFARVQSFFERDIVDYNTRRLILANFYATALLGRMYALLKEYSRDNEVMHLSEFNRLINSIVEDEDNPAPFIFERLGNRYRHFLIDEFQDTSIMQWHNLVPLVENGVSQGQGSLVVGDAKQAIYRFRQGDVRQFVRLPKVDGMLHHGKTLGLAGNYRFNPLDTNYRTAKAVVDFNNDFFSWLVRNRYAENTLAQDIYIGSDRNGTLREENNEELRQKIDSSLEGHVAVRLIDADEKEWVFEEVVSTIKLLVGERGYSYGDIMVLARSNDNLAKLSEYITNNTDIPQTSGLSFLLRTSDAAMAVVSALRCLNDRRDRVAAADLLQRLANLGIISSNHAEDMIGNGEFDLSQLLRNESSGIDLRPDYLQSLDIYDCCEELVRVLHLDGIDMPFVATLLDCAASFAARHRQQIGDFLEWFDDHKNDLSASMSDQLDAVRLLTVHKAKGLEAPVVICMFLPQKPEELKIWIDVPPEEGVDGPQLPTAYVKFVKEEPTRFDDQRNNESALNSVDDLNVLYVALTRPREQLYIVGKSKKGYSVLLEEYLKDSLVDGCADFGDAQWCKPLANKRSGMQKQVMALRRLSFADWTSKVSIASPSEKAVTPLLEDKVRFGIYAHDLMSGIVYDTDVDEALERFRQTHSVSDADIEVLGRMAHMVVGHRDAARFFARGNRVANEVSLMSDGELGRPDRVVFSKDATWVIDFKTGTPVPQNLAQVKSYCRAVSAMGYCNVSGWLIYLHGEGVDVVKVD